MLKEKTSNTIWIDKSAYMYLENESRRQRGCKPVRDVDRMWKRVAMTWKNSDKARVSDLTFGGGDGTYDGEWTSWSVKEVKRMLNENGFTYEDGEPMQYVTLYI